MKDVFTTEKVLQRAMRYLSEKPLSKAELKNRLERDLNHQGNADALIKKTLKRLEELSLFSDADVADLIVRRHTGKGDRFIRYKLEQSGIDPITIAKTLAELGDEVSRAREVALKKWPSYAGPDIPLRQSEQKLFRFLMSRGFSPGTCRDVLNTLEATWINARESVIHTEDE